MNFNTFINRFFGRDDTEASKNMAKERLRLVLVHDRLDISEQVMNALRVDLINVIGKYFGIDERTLDVSLCREADGMALVANIPIRRPRPLVADLAEAPLKPADAGGKTGAAGALPPAQAKTQEGSGHPLLFDIDEPYTPAIEKASPAKQEAAPKQSGGNPGKDKKENKARQTTGSKV